MSLFVDAEAYFRRQRMLSRRHDVLSAHPQAVSAHDVAPLMGDLEPEYWAWQEDMASWGKTPQEGTPSTSTPKEA